MDETRKAASVAQLKELHDAVMPRLDALESEDSAEGADPAQAALVQTLAARILMLEQKCDQLIEKLDEPDSPPDLGPILEAIAKMGEQQMAMLMKCMQDMARPVMKTGEAVLPDGGRIQLKVSETRN